MLVAEKAVFGVAGLLSATAGGIMYFCFIRCPSCGAFVTWTMATSAAVGEFHRETGLLQKCPACGDDGTGSDPGDGAGCQEES